MRTCIAGICLSLLPPVVAQAALQEQAAEQSRSSQPAASPENEAVTGQDAFLDSSLFAPVEHGGAITAEERPLLYKLLQHAAEVELRWQRDAAERFMAVRRRKTAELPDDPDPCLPVLKRMLTAPDIYTGKPVTFAASLRRIRERSADESSAGIETFYELRVRGRPPDDGWAVVFCNAVPEGLPLDQAVDEPIVLTGYCFKLYQPDGEQEPVPLLVADRPEWLRPRLDPALLESVEHRTFGIREVERDAYYRVLHATRVTDSRAQQQLARENVEERRAADPRYRKVPTGEFPVYVDVLKNPEKWRGKPATLRGYVRDFKPLPADGNPYCIKQLYEAWLFTEHSYSNPAVVICTEVPEDFPRDADLIDHVSVTGYFFKIYAYEAEDARRAVPLFLARRLEWHPERAEGVMGPLPPGVYYGVAVAIVGLVGWLGFLAWRDRKFRRERLQQMTKSAEEPEFGNAEETESDPKNSNTDRTSQ